MPRIAERLDFIKAGAVMVCLEAGTGRNLGLKNPILPENSLKKCPGKGNS
ncbi:MAG TPA: hypothetical protein VMX13_00755 [Sedimentisphaerales bacterium]|nr:hypothetical protein [Sedimentisphaerales bacterium]